MKARKPVAENNDKEPVKIGQEVQPYDRRRLSYANTFDNQWKANAIRAVEWLTAKLFLIRKIRQFEESGTPFGQPFFTKALKVMGIDLLTPEDQIARIPATGPLVVVANHPHGLVDGLVMAELIGRVRTDYKILTRSLLTGVQEIEEFMLPVAFPHEENSQRKNIEMRKIAMKHLEAGGVIILFPAGAVAHSPTFFGEAVEGEWNPFTAKMVLNSGANVLPIFFPGHNTRLYQIANLLSATFRQGLLLHEIKHAFNKAQNPVIGEPIPAEKVQEWKGNPRGLMAWMREVTLSLKN